MVHDNYFVITGAMGSGKSTVLNALNLLGIKTIQEPARQILAEQRSIEGEGVYDKNKQLFCDLMLSRSLFQYRSLQPHPSIIIFDRGIPDNIAYADLFGLNAVAAQNAAQNYRYNKHLFFFPGWKDIYQTDDERTMTYSQANAFGESVKHIYQTLGYEIITIPLVSPQKRAQFLIGSVLEISGFGIA